MQSFPARDPDWVKDYRLNVPLDPGDTLASLTFTKVSGAAVIERQEQDATGVTVWLSSGVDGEITEYRAVWTSTAGRTDDETITQRVMQGGDLTGQFVIRYPTFAAVPAQTIAYWLNDAGRIVTNAWMADDFAPATMALAAHNMALSGAITSGAANIPDGVTKFKSGTVDITLSGDAVSAKVKGGYGATSYGLDFLPYLRRNRGGPRLA